MEYKGYKFELNNRQDYEYLRNLVLKDYIGDYDRDTFIDYQSAIDILNTQYREHKNVETCVKEWQEYFEDILTQLEREHKDYEFELNMSKEYQKKKVWDEWGMAYVFSGKLGAEYNYYVDVNYKQDGTEERIDASAIYLMWEEDNGFWETDVDCFEHYEIEWDKED